MTKKLLISVIMQFICFLNINAEQTIDCEKYNKFRLSYNNFESEEVNKTRSGYTGKVSKDIENNLVLFGKTLNEMIIKKEISKILANVSTQQIIHYSVSGGNTIDYYQANIAKKFITQMKTQNGHYFNFIFNNRGIIQEIDDMPKPSWDNSKYVPDSSLGEDLDIRQYIICFKDVLRWKVRYNNKENKYLVQFSIPDQFLISFAWFGYVVGIEQGKFVLVGF